MSLASIKLKEAKGKKNVLPKLRTILGNPYKQHSPVLPEDDLLQFRQLLQEAMIRSGHTKKTFATHANIHIGLESSLRAINAGRFCCAFISLSLRPAHLIRLIATSASVKAPTAPVYAQPKLEELTYDLFGVRALTLVLPLNVSDTSQELDKWIAARRRPLREKQQIIAKTVKKPKLQMAVQNSKQDIKAPPSVILPTTEKKQWSGDFISCSGAGVIKLDQVNEQLDEALNDLTMKAKSKASIDKPPALNLAVAPPVVSRMDVEESKEKTNDAETQIDDFLPIDKYRPLVVHEVRSNPNKKPKKKRNKKKNKLQKN